MRNQPNDQPQRRFDRGDGFVARSATAADLPAMLQVLQSTFAIWPPVPSDRSALDYLEWKMTPPGRGPADHGVAEFEGRLIAVKLRWFGRAWLRGTEQVIDIGADMAALAEFQGRGIGRLLNDLEEYGDRNGGTISIERSSQVASVRHMEVDHRRFGARTWVRPLTARAAVAAHRTSGGLLGLIRAALRRPRRGARSAEVTLREFDRFDERVDALWLAARDRFDLARIRDADELNWRYADPRGGRCTRIGAFAGDRLLAYGVFRLRERELHLLDLLTHPDHADAAQAVLRAGSALGRRERATNVVAWVVPGHPDEPIYRAASFVAVDEFSLSYKVPRGSSAPQVQADLYDPTLRRHVSMGDFDFA